MESTFNLTLTAADFPRASDLFEALAQAFAMFKAGAPARPAVVQHVEQQQPAVGEAEQPKRRGRPKAADAAPAEHKPTEAALPETAAPEPTIDERTDEQLLEEIRQTGNKLMSEKGPSQLAQIMKDYGVKKYGDLTRAQRLEVLPKLAALLAA